MVKTSGRSMLERAKEIFAIIDCEEDFFPKSNLKKAGLNPNTAEKWLELIEFIQNQPKIRVVKSKRSTMVEKIEGKFSPMSLKSVLKDDLSIDQRMTALEAYFSSILVHQRLKKPE